MSKERETHNPDRQTNINDIRSYQSAINKVNTLSLVCRISRHDNKYKQDINMIINTNKTLT